MKIYYGKMNVIDVSNILNKSLPIVIPKNDIERSVFFGRDPDPGIVKEIRIIDDYGKLDIILKDISCKIVKDVDDKLVVEKNYEDVLKLIHNKLTIKYGTFEEEYPEQVMAVMFIQPWMKVLEIGANIGRNSLVISNLLSSSSNLKVVESDPVSVNKLYDNKRINNLNFEIIDSAISKNKLIQNHWITKYLETKDIPNGWKLVNTIEWNNILYRHGPFDCLVADCEGALYNILKEEPNFFNYFNLIIMENDYENIEHKNFVDAALNAAGFKCVYKKEGGWGPCYNFFFETWKKNN